MGLDMYLNRMPRYKKATASVVNAVEGYLDWQKAKMKGVSMQIAHGKSIVEQIKIYCLIMTSLVIISNSITPSIMLGMLSTTMDIIPLWNRLVTGEKKI